MKTIIGQQGEVRIIKIDRMPDGLALVPVSKTSNGKIIISHSESGHHHVLTGGTVMERTNDVASGMRVLYAILDAPAQLRQTASGAHAPFDLGPGVYEFRCSREYNPFSEQARRVTD